MDRDALVVALARLRAAWDIHLGPSRRRASVALVFLVFFAGAHVARLGSPAARAGAVGAFGLTLLALAIRSVVARRRRQDPRRVVMETVARTDPELGAATLRALTLVDRMRSDASAGSSALADLHLQRLLSRVSLDRLGEVAGGAALRWSTAGLCLAACSTALVAIEPFRIIEGLDVLAARAGEAPLPLRWVDEVAMGAAPPDYLRQQSSEPRPFNTMKEPRGTTITVRGRPLRPGRSIVLTDGATSVPFVDDGAGHIVARWTLGNSTSLWIAAEFGDPAAGGVRVRQVDEQRVESVPDETPRVTVEGAPRIAHLMDEPSIPIHYEATDDHGLREVDLVFRAGTREVRRVLSHPGADVLVDRGGYEVLSSDDFFKKTYAPVEIRVEARDNDAVSGPKWGKSAAIVVIPPQVGEPEALRYQALLKARDALVDLTAYRVTEKAPAGAASKEHVRHEEEAQATAAKRVDEVVTGTYGGLSLRGRVVAVARGQFRRLKKALAAEKKAPSAATHQKLLDETEEVLLAFDSGVRGQGYRDSQAVAKRLADVAEDLAAALSPQVGEASRESSAEARAEAGIAVLDGGGAQLRQLGDLGVDLGEIVANDLRRIARARAAHDLFHAELAARDLAARLRRPEPSFSGGGGHGGGNGGKGQGGVESGASGGAESGEASEADEQAAQDAHDLEELAREHAGKIGDVEDALERAVSEEEIDQLKREAKEHADAVREAVKNLPPPHAKPGSAEAEAADAREEGEAMAGALEGGRPRDAVENGKRALDKLREAQRASEAEGGSLSEGTAEQIARRAKPTLERELAWAEDALEKLRRASSGRAKGDLQRLAKDEQRLAEKARELAKRGESGDHAMPGDMLDRLGEAEQAMHEARRSLEAGESDGSLKHQRDAQRLLEMARGESEDGKSESGREDTEGQKPKGKTDVPGKDKHKGPEEFRKRVLQGLGGSSDPLLRDAVKRYAEGLLK